MITFGMVGLIFILILIIGAGISLFYISRRLTALSRSMFGTDSLLEGLEQQEELLAETPKSVAGMTSFYLPRIQKDFPEFSYEEFVQKSENQLKAALTCVEREDLSFLSGASSELRKQISLWIEDNKSQEIREQFQNTAIHRTVISRYEKQAGCCIIVFQSAVEYGYARWENGKEQPKAQKTQTRYNMEWVYIQNAEKLPEERRAVGFNCPNCGAPVRAVGSRFCEYCGSGIEPLNIRVWSLDHIEKKGGEY